MVFFGWLVLKFILSSLVDTMSVLIFFIVPLFTFNLALLPLFQTSYNYLCLAACSLLAQDAHKVDSLKGKLLSSEGDDRFEILTRNYLKLIIQPTLMRRLIYAGDFSDLALAIGDSARIVQYGII